MDPIERELREKLAEGPAGLGGFDDRLKQRIERKIGEKPVRKPHRWSMLLGGAGAAFAALFVVVFLQLGGMTSSKSAEESKADLAMEMKSAPVQAQAASGAAKQKKTRSALLLGLRADQQGAEGDSSTYRTLLIAPEKESLAVTAEGRGILMPYEQQFWRLQVTAGEKKGDTGARIVAVLASKSKPQAEPSGAALEKLLFVGNRYMAIERQGKGGSVWVKELPQLTSSARSDDPQKDPHVSLAKVLGEGSVENAGSITGGESAEPAFGESWTIVRKRGQWVAALAEYEDARKDYTINELPLQLPESVVNHDKVTIRWSDVVAVQPQAEDAFQSPEGDMLAVVSPGHIDVYQVRGGIQAEEELSIPLAGKESVIMAQWATDSYVDMWKKQASQYLGEAGAQAPGSND